MGLEALQDCPVPEMHAIEVPDGDGQGRVGLLVHNSTFMAAPSYQHRRGPKPRPLPAVDGEEVPVGIEQGHGGTRGVAGIGITERPAVAHRPQVVAGDGHRLVVA